MPHELQEAALVGAQARCDSMEEFAVASLGAVVPHTTTTRWAPYLQRYASGEWRAPIFRDLILADARALQANRETLTLLDIGCGKGFDGSTKLQQSLAEVATQYIGVEPDPAVELQANFTAIHRCFFEDAPIEDESVDIAFAVMVLEHIPDPRKFWDKIHRVLRKGGCFWGLTVDARHWFVLTSALMEKLRLKDLYLDKLHGKRGEARYENYPAFYRINTPRQILKFTSGFSTTNILNFNRTGQMDFYIPEKLRWLGRSLDNLSMRAGWPGSVMAMRVEK